MAQEKGNGKKSRPVKREVTILQLGACVFLRMKENPFEIVPSNAKLTALKTTGVDKKGVRVEEEKLFWISIG